MAIQVAKLNPVSEPYKLVNQWSSGADQGASSTEAGGVADGNEKWNFDLLLDVIRSTAVISKFNNQISK